MCLTMRTQLSDKEFEEYLGLKPLQIKKLRKRIETYGQDGLVETAAPAAAASESAYPSGAPSLPSYAHVNQDDNDSRVRNFPFSLLFLTRDLFRASSKSTSRLSRPRPRPRPPFRLPRTMAAWTRSPSAGSPRRMPACASFFWFFPSDADDDGPAGCPRSRSRRRFRH
mgnify:CR=1 FL=1